MKHQKLVIYSTLFATFMSALTACSGNNAPSGDSSKDGSGSEAAANISFPLKDQVKLKMVACKHPNNGAFQDMEFFKQYEQKTNVKIDWTNIELAQCNEQRNLIFASNDLPDAFYGNITMPGSDVLNYGGQGMLVPLEKYITKETMPNLHALLESNPKYRSIITAPDGHIYSLPNIRELKLWLSPDMMYLNKEWLDKLGLAVPTTMDEFYNVLQAFKTKDPNGNGKADEIPFSFAWDYRFYNVNGIGSLFGAFGRADSVSHMFVENDKVIYSAREKEYKNAINYFHKFFKEGLFDIESLTQDNKMLIAKGSAPEPRLGGFFAWNAFSVVGVDRDPKYVVVPALKGPEGHQIWRKTLSNNQGVNPFAFSMTAVNKNPELTMKWIDLSYATDTSIEAGWGPINVTLEDNNGQLKTKQPPAGMTIDEYVFKTAPVEAPYAILEKTYGSRLALAEKDKIKIDAINEKYLPYMKSETFPGVLFSPQESEKIKTLETDLNSFVSQSSAKWLLEGNADQEWDAYMASLKKMKLDELVGVYQSAYDRFKNASK
ncbi:extracellular solute-binding protein [Paenibacillus sp. YYML68]|uniref:extracellular solute-binding protein n=1 Tax=Paenibacillus sp. YYML68 TaxID=2909250 RepID=UPI0024923366|nr:extracellular solute-binding protein [Paenibacillus sp. YYML68]